MSRLSSQPHFPKQPLPVSHKPNAIWWLILIVAVITGHELPKWLASTSKQTLPLSASVENQAFLALSFGKVSKNPGLALSASGLLDDLTAIKQAGYQTVGLAQVNRWRASNDESLPNKPLLLTFEEANRETIEIVDPLLAELGMTATVFVDVAALEQANIHLVSWHKLALMAKTGRWEVGISACPNGDDQGLANPALLAEKLAQHRQLLEQRLQMPVLVADCSRAWNPEYGDGSAVWPQTLTKAGLSIGFVAAASGANYHDDPQANFKRIRVLSAWSVSELLSQLHNHQPRRAELVEQFSSELSASAWIVDSGELFIEPSHLQLTNTPGEQGGLISLAGTEKWRDADVQVQLTALPQGQFWLSVRNGIHQPVVRLGVANGQVLLQESVGTDIHRQLARVDIAEGGLNLRLRVIGHAVMAYLNNQPLLPRPIAMPKPVKQGSVALAVWQPELRNDQSAQALVNISKISAKPIESKIAIISPALDENGWQQLRQSADQLTTLSPKYFAWKKGKPQVLATYDSALAIFAGYHRLKFQPALVIDQQTPFSDTPLLAKQIISWVNQPGFDGLNLVFNDSLLDDGWRAFLTDLIQRIRQTGKTLIVTRLDVMHSAEVNDYLLLDAQVEPSLLEGMAWN